LRRAGACGRRVGSHASELDHRRARARFPDQQPCDCLIRRRAQASQWRGGACRCKFEVGAAIAATAAFDVRAASERALEVIFQPAARPPRRVKYLARCPPSISHPPLSTQQPPPPLPHHFPITPSTTPSTMARTKQTARTFYPPLHRIASPPPPWCRTVRCRHQRAAARDRARSHLHASALLTHHRQVHGRQGSS
jgi:hypothetical protein